MAGKWPSSLQLPAGRVVDVKAQRSGPPASVEARCVFADARALFESKAVELFEGGEPVDPAGLSLAEFHALRAIATKLGWLDEQPIEIECRNCQAPVETKPCASLPLGPFVDHELIDPEIDVTLDLQDAHPIDPIDLPRRAGSGARERKAATVRLGPVTLAEALPLHQALEKQELRVTSAVVRAMGILALGDEEDPGVIARALTRCSDEAFGAVTDLFLATHYPLRLGAPVVCPSCGSRNDVDAPYDREFDPSAAVEDARAPEVGPAARAVGSGGDFPSLDEFDAFAQKVAEPMLAQAPGPEIALVIEGGVPACDDGGEPLMGSYVPAQEGGAHGPSSPPELTLYYKTFAAMWSEDGPYDWKEEVRETIEHELEHHVFGIEGYDPKDEAERDEIAREAQRVVGKRALARAGASAFAADVADFWKRTWIFWIVGLIVVVISVLAAR